MTVSHNSGALPDCHNRDVGFIRLLPIGAIGLGVLCVAVPSSSSGRPTTYAAVSPGAEIADLTAGLGLLAAGALVVATGRRGSVGPLVAGLGGAWLAQDWIGWEGGPAAVRTVAVLASALLVPMLAHLVLAFPAGLVSHRGQRAALGVAYGFAGLLAVALLAVRDPAFDQYCWANCDADVLLVHADVALGDDLRRVWSTNVAVLGVATGVFACWRLLRATTVARRTILWPFTSVAAAGASQAGLAVLLLREPAEDPTRTPYVLAFLLCATALAGVAASITWWVRAPGAPPRPCLDWPTAWAMRPAPAACARSWPPHWATRGWTSPTG